MYRDSPPLFDVPEFPPLRRLKPLPKRRRTIDLDSKPTNSINMLGAEGLAEELIAHADSLSSQMALQSYYMPMLDEMQNLLRGDGEINTADGIDFGVGYQLADEQLGREDDHDEDYVDHLQQPGNTKKRKVPANAFSLQGHDFVLGLDVEDEALDAGVLTSGRPDQNVSDSGARLTQRKGKISAPTLAGLQHKEMLKHRKKQLAAVLGALTHGDTLALDQALSSHYPFNMTNIADIHDSDLPHVHLSRRRGPRLARATKVRLNGTGAALHSANKVAFPTSQFGFICHSATSDRLVAIKEEVAVLRSRFEAELGRQAVKAAKAAAEAKKAALAASKGTRSKRSEKGRQQVSDGTADSQDLSLSGRGSKKKKRSALAIASNPHHRKNYVPSRLPQPGQANAAQATLNAQNSVGPLPLGFLSTEIPPRRRQKSGAPPPTSHLVNPSDEWICPFCEYKLFYGGEGPEYRRAIRARKQILRRRRRAQERAAGGLSAPKAGEKSTTGQEESDSSPVPSPTEFTPPSVSNKAESKEGPDIAGKSKGRIPLQSSFG